MKKKLSELKIGEKGITTQVLGEGRFKRRLMDMGITIGIEIYLMKKAPLGDPLEITVRNYELALRKSEAEKVILEVE